VESLKVRPQELMGPFWLGAITSENLNNETHSALHISTRLEVMEELLFPASD
jgi:hypothetical protein